MLERVISGGQTGVDRGALDVASELGLPRGGWCPCGRRSADGTIPDHYPLRETPTARYAERTEWNVRDGDATLILAAPPLTAGTELTARLARRHHKPLLVMDPARLERADEIAPWILRHDIRVLNVAGPREARGSAIYDTAVLFLRRALSLALGVDTMPRR